MCPLPEFHPLLKQNPKFRILGVRSTSEVSIVGIEGIQEKDLEVVNPVTGE